MITLTEHGTPALDTIHHCRAEALLSAMDTGSVDLIVTSPPYDNLRSYNGFAWNFEYIAQQAYRVLKVGGVMVWVVGDATVDGSETLSSFKQAIHFRERVGFRVHDTMIWDKRNIPGTYGKRYEQIHEYMFVLSKGEPKAFNPILRKNTNAGQIRSTHRRIATGTNGHRKVTVNDYSIDRNIWVVGVGGGHTSTDGTSGHPAMFPEALAERHIMTWSNPNDIVMDFFGGSGTTSKMARANGRRYVTCDISKVYCDLMQKRLAQAYTLPMLLETA